MNCPKLPAVLLAPLLASPLLGLTGCTQLLTEDQRALVTALGIDRGPDGRLSATAEWYTGANPATVSGGGSSGGTAQAVNRTASGENLANALAAIQAGSARRVDLSITGSLLLGEQAARTRGADLLDVLFRDSDFPVETFTAVALPSAQSILEAEVLGGVGFRLFTHMRHANAAYNGSLPVPLWRFLSDSRAPCQGAYLPLLERDPSGFRATGTALFLGGRMVDRLSPQETVALGYLLGQQPYGNLTVPSPGGGRPLSLRVRSIALFRRGDPEALALDLRLVTDLREAEQVSLSEARRQGLDRLATAAAWLSLAELLRHLKADGVDLTGLGRLACARQPRLAANWPAEWRSRPVRLTVRVHVTSDGRVA